MKSSGGGRPHTVRVVTGASGRIGGVLARALADRYGPGRIRAIYRERRGTAADLDIAWINGDILDKASLVAAFKGAETVFHLAARVSIDAVRAQEFHRTNVVGTRNVVEAALACGVRRLVHVSSIHAYDQHPLEEVLDESRGPADGPHHDPYDRSKAAGEVEIRRGIDRGLDAVILNPTSVIGPCDGGPSSMGQVFLDLYRRRIPALIASGYDWVDVRDVVSATMAAETQARCGENYLVSGRWYTVRKLAQLSQQATGVPAPRLQFPVFRRPVMGTLPGFPGSISRSPAALHAGGRSRHGPRQSADIQRQGAGGTRVPPAPSRRIGQRHVSLVRRARHAG